MAKKGFGFNLLTNPIILLIINLILFGTFFYRPMAEQMTSAFGPSLLKVIVLAEFLSAVVVAIRMGLTAKLIYRLLNSFSLKIILLILLSAIMIFGMIDKIFLFFIGALIFIIVDLYAIETEEKYYSGNVLLLILFTLAVVFNYTNSIPIVSIFLILFVLNSLNRKIEPYDWVIFFLYFIIPINYYSTGTLDQASLWVGLYFLFKSMNILLEIFGSSVYRESAKIMKFFNFKQKKEKYFWSHKEEILFTILLLAPVIFRFLKYEMSEIFMTLWASSVFLFLTISILFIDPEWWKKYYSYRAKAKK